MRQEIFETALKRILELAKTREQEGAELPSVILRHIQTVAQEALKRP